MRKTIAFILLVSVLFCLAACGKDETSTAPTFNQVTVDTKEDVSGLSAQAQLTYYVTEYMDSFAFRRLHKPYLTEYGQDTKPFYINHAEVYRLENIDLPGYSGDALNLYLLDVSCDYLRLDTQEHDTRLRLVIDRETGSIYDAFFVPDAQTRMDTSGGDIKTYEDLLCNLLTKSLFASSVLYREEEVRITVEMDAISEANSNLSAAQ